MSKEAEELTYNGHQDITVWLQEVNGEHDPVIIPYQPDPGHAAVFLEWLRDPAGPQPHPYLFGTVYDGTAVMRYRRPGRLWFCNVPVRELCRHTSAQRVWFAAYPVRD